MPCMCMCLLWQIPAFLPYFLPRTMLVWPCIFAYLRKAFRVAYCTTGMLLSFSELSRRIHLLWEPHAVGMGKGNK